MRTSLLFVILTYGALQAIQGAFWGQVLSAIFIAALSASSRPMLVSPLAMAIVSIAAFGMAGIGNAIAIRTLVDLGVFIGATCALCSVFGLAITWALRLVVPSGILLSAHLFLEGASLPLIRSFAAPDGGKVGYIQSGVWASPRLNNSEANIESAYSSSCLLRAMDGEEIDASKGLPVLRDYRLLVLFMPTKPIQPADIDKLAGWVKSGGRLVVVVDHTDLFGHARVANEVLARFGVRAEHDAVIPTDGGYVYYRGLSGRHAGLTACSLRGDGDPVYFATGFSEAADYGGNSFFSDLTPTEGDRAGVFLVGLRTTHGLGQVVTFGDSTFFANFAINRHSSSSTLRHLLSPSPGYPVHDIALMACLLIILPLRIAIGCIATCLALVIAGKSGMPATYSDKRVPRDSFVFSGDSDMTDKEYGPMAGLIAAHYAYSDKAVAWGDTRAGSGELVAGDIVFRQGTTVENRLPMRQGMKAELSPALSRLIQTRDLACVTHFGSIWFDDSVGAVREAIFKSFWRREELRLAIRNVETLRFATMNGREFGEPMEVKVHWLSCGDGWALLGEGYVARWITEKQVFLVRKSWQFNGINSDTSVLGSCLERAPQAGR